MTEATTIKCTPDSLSIPEIGLACTPYPLDSESLDAIVDLLDEAEADGTEPLDDGDPDEGPEPLDGEPAPPDTAEVEPVTDIEAEEPELFPEAIPPDFDQPGPTTAVATEPECAVLVRVLGEIRIDGGESLSPKQTAVVTYIALIGDVATERVQDAVWASPKSGCLRKRLANTVSDCRSRISPLLLPSAPDGRYRAGPGLATDLELFEQRVSQAVGQCATDAVDTLRSALDLVEGPLFTYRNADRSSYAWVDTENWVSTWEIKVAAAAQECADLLLELERPDEAANVALHALCVIPTHTALTETLMRAHADNGHRHAAQRVYEEHGGALQTLGIEDPEESTTDLFDRLCRATTQ